jgi:Txe/YoeB family toxin of Txe-Axe toxin-antitoxin module
MMYLITIRRIGSKLLRFSNRPALSIIYEEDRWPMYYSSFNIIMIKKRYPKYNYVQIKDAIDLLILNGHAKTFPHHAKEEYEHLKEDYKGLYQRYITTDSGSFAFRSGYYFDDIVFNVILSRITILKAVFGTVAIYILVKAASLLSGIGESKKIQPSTIVIILQSNKLAGQPIQKNVNFSDTIFLKTP